MKKILLFAALTLLSAGAVAAQHVTPETRVGSPAAPTPTDIFQHYLENLYLAVEKRDANQMIVTQSELMGEMRTAILSSRTAIAGSEPARRKERMQTIFDSFEKFSFHNVSKEEATPQLALLEEFLALMQN